MRRGRLNKGMEEGVLTLAGDKVSTMEVENQRVRPGLKSLGNQYCCGDCMGGDCFETGVVLVVG